MGRDDAASTIAASTVAIVLAAGAGSRFRGTRHKLLTPLHGRAVLDHVLDHVTQAGFGHVVVVTGAVDVGEVIAPWSRHVPGMREVHHLAWAQGQAGSLHAGIDAARALGATAVVVGLGDQPFVPASAWRAVALAAGSIVVASYEGQRSPPVKLHHSVWPLLPTTGDEGARALMRLRPDLVSAVPCSGNPGDIDTLEDLARWSSTTNSPSTDPSTKPGPS